MKGWHEAGQALSSRLCFGDRRRRMQGPGPAICSGVVASMGKGMAGKGAELGQRCRKTVRMLQAGLAGYLAVLELMYLPDFVPLVAQRGGA